MTETTEKPVAVPKPPPKKRGRRTKLTIEVIDRICDFIRAGNYQKVAAANCGVKERTWYHWLERARDVKRPTIEQRHLLQSVAMADAQFEALHVQRIMGSADPKVSLEMLSRRFPERWASTRHTTQRQVGKDGEDVPIKGGVIVVPGPMDEAAWIAAAQRYKLVQPRAEESADEAK